LRASDGLHIDLGQRHGPNEVLTETAAFARELWAAEPGLGQSGTECIEDFEAARPTDTAYRLVHGAFSASAVMDVGGGPGIIDWDRFGQGALELDAGFLLARFQRLEQDHSGSSVAKQAKRARKTFRDGLNGLVNGRALCWYRAAALVKAAHRRARRRSRRWEKDAGAYLDEAKSSLAEIS
jgi:aminoglycoside phosphotransferase (APT) family kinase protein